MAKKLKKTKKPMSPKTKNIAINSFKGIISNQACIENGKEAPWWLAILFLLVSILIPLIPNFVSLNNAYGASFVSNATYGLDTGLARASIQLKKDGKTLNVENGLLSYSDTASEDPIYSYTDANTNRYTFLMYFSDYQGSELQNFVNKIVNQKFILNKDADGKTIAGSTTIYNPELDPDKKEATYTPSFVILSPSTLVAATYKADTTTRVANTFGGLDWNNTPNGDLLERITSAIKDENGNVIDINTIDLEHLPTQVTSQAFGVWKNIFNETFLNQKNTNKWNTTLIYLGVYTGLTFFLGLMLFLLTRSKTNPFRTLNFWVTQKIAYFLALTPAILALILGFVMAGNIIGQMAFVLLLSLRVMWASMKQLRPVA